MPHSSHNATDFVAAATSNEPIVVAALAKHFPKSTFRVPLTTLKGVKNRPETALELGARLPIHALRLDNGESAIPLFTNAALCRRCAERLSWNTDGKSIKALKLPGGVTLDYLKELLVTPGFGRAVVNPLDDGALHLSRTDIEAMSSARPLQSLWFYSRNGRLKVPVEVEGGSLLDSFLSLAERALQRRDEDPVFATVMDPAPMLDKLWEGGPLGRLSAELYELLSRENVRDVEITLTPSEDGIEVTSRPEMRTELLSRVRAVAEKHLGDDPTARQVSLRIEGGSIVVSSSSSYSKHTRAPEPSPPKSPSFTYIPLEPEEESRE